MSGTPKYSQAELNRQRQQQLEAERQRRAQEEARRRAEVEERERKRRLENRRQQAQRQLQEFADRIAQAYAYPQAIEQIQAQHHQLQQQVNGARQESEVQSALTALVKLDRQLDEAITQKRRDDQEKKRLAELEKQQLWVAELERRIALIPVADATKFDPAGKIASRQAIDATLGVIAKGNPATVRSYLTQAEQIVTQHSDRVAEERAKWQQRLAQAEQAKGEIQTILAGLEADEVVMRWQGSVVSQLQSLVAQAETAISIEEFEQVGTLLSQLQLQRQTIIADANTAQLKADKRNFIASSIAQVLQEMGFTIVQQEFEYPDHPASAIILAAANNAGKGISVSVPAEGEVFYDVEGYPKNLATAVCDEAETVLNEMHDILAEQFGIQMGEVMWEGKAPNRNLRRADELPRSSRQRSQGV